MCVAMDERSEIVDTVNVFIPIHIPHPAPFAAGGVDGIRLHEHRGARVASRQARQRAIMHLPRSRFVVWIHFSSLQPEAAAWVQSFCERHILLDDPVEHGRDVSAELLGIFTHREVTELLHDHDLGACDACRGPQRIGRLAREIVFAGQQEQRAPAGVDRGDASTQIAVDPIEIEIALEYARAALLVSPQCLAPRRIRALRSDQAGHQGGADFATMNVRPVQPFSIVPGRLEVRCLQSNQRPEFGRVIDGKVENDAAADGTSHHHRPIQRQRPAERPYRFGIARRGQTILLAIPAFRRVGLAVPWHVEGDDSKISRKARIRQQMPPLPRIRARRVQTHQRNAGTVLLEIDAIDRALYGDMNVAADNWLDQTGHCAFTLRGSASTSLKYCRWVMNGNRSPSRTASPPLVSASRSWQPGRGTGFQNSIHVAADNRYEKHHERINSGPSVTLTIRPAAKET